ISYANKLARGCMATASISGRKAFSLGLPCVFSPKSRQYLALCAQDGRLRIWNTDIKTLNQEYVPSAHLSATCTCISWGPCRKAKEGPQRKKRKSEAGQVENQVDLLALGTAAGSVIIYSTVKGALHCTLDGGHSGGVNCVQWHPEDCLLYSGSDDTHIVEWDLQTGKARCKWKADRASVTSLCVSPDGKLLLSAGHAIKMWDLETKEVYRKFTGHSTAVTTLRFATTRPPDSNGLYFISGAAHDRLLSVWQVREDGKDKNSVVSFNLTDEPHHIDLFTSNSKEEAVRLAVVCRDGQLHLFEHFLNGPCKKPLSPLCTVQITGVEDSPVPVPLLAAALTTDTHSLLLAYGNHLQPVMERVVSGAHRGSYFIPSLKGTDAKEMSIEERLGKIQMSPEKGVKGAPSLQTDNFSVLLVQGLESKDANILNKVFQNRKDFFIKTTIARLPLPAVLPLVEEITKRMQGHPYTAVLMVRWLKAVLMQHTSYLASLPDLVFKLGVLYHMIESRVKMFHKLTKLHGKLYLLMTQVRLSSCSKIVHLSQMYYLIASSSLKNWVIIAT
uniref:WD repeat domain 43 n=1 Tax=Salmo trutta TaxID=8032 RepID=A0A673W897_SALTR